MTANLRKYFPEARFEADAATLGELLRQMDARRPFFSTYLVEENGDLRKHVNVFINGDVVPRPGARDHALPPGAEIHLMQALSGG